MHLRHYGTKRVLLSNAHKILKTLWHDMTLFSHCDVKDFTLWDSALPLGQWKLIQEKFLKVLVVYYYLPLAGDPCSIGELTRDVY